jgi:hypothetical protein
MARRDVIDVSGLPEPFVGALEAAISAYRKRVDGPGNGARRPIGWAKGALPELPESFFEPLPDELLDLFDGKPQ